VREPDTLTTSLRGARILLLAHAVITAAAGVVLLTVPDAIPRVVGVSIPGEAFLLCYLLAAAEFGLSWLSLWGARSTDRSIVRGVILTCVAFHAASGAVEVLALLRGVSPTLWLNVAARVIVVVLFIYFLPKLASKADAPSV
jgi:hypothetical protein